jgi:hypothetical protein
MNFFRYTIFLIGNVIIGYYLTLTMVVYTAEAHIIEYDSGLFIIKFFVILLLVTLLLFKFVGKNLNLIYYRFMFIIWLLYVILNLLIAFGAILRPAYLPEILLIPILYIVYSSVSLYFIRDKRDEFIMRLTSHLS